MDARPTTPFGIPGRAAADSRGPALAVIMAVDGTGRCLASPGVLLPLGTTAGSHDIAPCGLAGGMSSPGMFSP